MVSVNIKHDITSAITVSFLTIAAGAAFGLWTGVGSSIGILSMAVASIFGFVFGGIQVKTSGPTGPTAGVMFAGVVALNAANVDTIYYAHILFGASLCIFILSFLPIEKALNIVPHVSLAVFVNGISLYIVYKQCLNVIDLSSNVWEIAIICSTIIILVLWPKISKTLSFIRGHSIISGVLFVMALGGLINYFFSPDINTLSIESLSVEALLSKMDSLLSLQSIPLTLALMLVAKTVFVITLVTAVTAKALNQEASLAKELKNQSLANALVSFIGGIPVTIGFIRTKVLQRSGANSIMAGVLTGVFVVFIIVFFKSILEMIPTSVFIGILINAGFSSLDLEVWHDYRKGNRSILPLLYVITGSLLVVWYDLVIVFIASLLVWKVMQLLPSAKTKCIDLKTCPCVD